MRRAIPAALAIAGIVLPWVLPAYALTLLAYVGLSALVALGLVLLTGIAGQTSFGQATFVGIAAYTSAYLAKVQGLSPFLGLPGGLLASGIVAWLLGLITTRLSGHYLALASVAWGISFYYLFATIAALGGFNGMADIPTLSLFGYRLTDPHGWLYLIWAVLIACIWLAHNLMDSRHGRAIRALATGRAMADSLGIDTARLSRAVFVLAALAAGLSGWLFAHYQLFINPSPFSLDAGIEYLFMVIVGGLAWLWGAVLGAGVVVVLRDQLNDLLPRLIGQPGNYETIVFAVAVILILQRAPAGLWPLLRRIAAPAPPALPAAAERLPRRTPPEAGTAPALELLGATRRFGGLVAANAIDFDVRPGEIVALIGPNGAGKTTVFNLVSGALRPDAGRIRIFGQEAAGLPARDIARRGVARTFQHVRLLPERSVLENIALGAHQRGSAGLVAAMLRLDRAEERRLLAEAARQAARAGLTERLAAPAGALPLGQQRIVEIARALAADPLLLLLDEPAAGLRLREKAQLATLLQDLRAEGMSVLLVEHDMDFVMNLADRVVVMDFGQRIAAGVPRTVQRDPMVLEAYLGGIE